MIQRLCWHSHPYMTDIISSIHMTPHDSTSTPKQDYPRRKRPTLKQTQAMQSEQRIPPDVWRAIQYLEYRNLRHNHPHV